MTSGIFLPSIIAHMTFEKWLQQELDKRGWDQNELAKRSERAGYKISQSQLSRIMSGERQAGPDACIAIAYAFGIPREEVFRMRGWLLREPEETIAPGRDPRVRALAERLDAMPPVRREKVMNSLEAILHTIDEIGG